MLAFMMFEVVAAMQICIQNWLNFEDIPHDIYLETQQNKTPSKTNKIKPGKIKHSQNTS